MPEPGCAAAPPVVPLRTPPRTMAALPADPLPARLAIWPSSPVNWPPPGADRLTLRAASACAGRAPRHSLLWPRTHRHVLIDIPRRRLEHIQRVWCVRADNDVAVPCLRKPSLELSLELSLKLKLKLSFLPLPFSGRE